MTPPRPAAGAVRRRRQPVVAPERLGELGRLAVADALGDLADGQDPARQQVGRRVHANAGQMRAERRVADLGVGALQLAPRGRDAAGDVVERKVARRTPRSTIATASS